MSLMRANYPAHLLLQCERPGLSPMQNKGNYSFVFSAYYRILLRNNYQGYVEILFKI
jgi:hypothetical protein